MTSTHHPSLPYSSGHSSPQPIPSPDLFTRNAYLPSSPTPLPPSPTLSASSPTLPYYNRQVPFSPTFTDELFSSYLDSRYPTSPTSSATSYLYNSSNPQPSSSATAFSSQAMAVPLLAPVRDVTPVSFSSDPLPSSVSSSASFSAPASHSQPTITPMTPDYALTVIERMARKRERDRDNRVEFPHRDVQSDPAWSRYPPQYHPPSYDQLSIFPPPDSSTAPATSSPLPVYSPAIMAPPTSDQSMMYRKSSCLLCHRAKTSCDGRRPCDRCIRLDRQEQCVERTKTTTKRGKGMSGKKRKSEDGEESKEAEKDDDKDEHMEEEETASPIPHDVTTIAPRATSSPIPTTSHSHSHPSSTPSSRVPLLTEPNDVLVGVNDRELSSLMLRILQSDQTSIRTLLQTASQRRLIPAMAFQALISYIANALHPEDYATFMQWIDADRRRLLGSDETPTADRLQVRLPDGRVMPRVLFTFRKSRLDALPDHEMAVNTAMILVWIPKPSTSTSSHAAGGGGEVNGKRKLTPVVSSGGREGENDGKVKKEGEDVDRLSSPEPTAALTPSPTTPNPISPPAVSGIASTDSDSHPPSSPGSVASSSSSSTTSAHPSAPSSSSLPTTSKDSPVVPAPIPGATFDSLSEVDLLIQVNREFERLFGYSQREMKDLMMREGSKGLYRLYTPQSLTEVGRWLTEACVGIKTEFRSIVTVVNKFKGLTPTVLNARFILDPRGFFNSVCYSYTPMPDPLG